MRPSAAAANNFEVSGWYPYYQKRAQMNCGSRLRRCFRSQYHFFGVINSAFVFWCRAGLEIFVNSDDSCWPRSQYRNLARYHSFWGIVLCAPFPRLRDHFVRPVGRIVRQLEIQHALPLAKRENPGTMIAGRGMANFNACALPRDSRISPTAICHFEACAIKGTSAAAPFGG